MVPSLHSNLAGAASATGADFSGAAAGCGTDAAPYFRIFNPITQGQKFDPAGDYVRRYVPELRAVPCDILTLAAVHAHLARPAATYLPRSHFGLRN